MLCPRCLSWWSLSVFPIIFLYSTPFLYTVTLVFILMHPFLIIIYQKNLIISYYFSYFDEKWWSKFKIFSFSSFFFLQILYCLLNLRMCSVIENIFVFNFPFPIKIRKHVYLLVYRPNFCISIGSQYII